MAALCKSYSAQLEAGGEFFAATWPDWRDQHRRWLTTASGLLKAANLAVFELRVLAELDRPINSATH